MPDWFEELPEECPPKDAFSPNGQTFYRLVKGQPVTLDDFISQQAEFPWKELLNIDKCIIRAVSVFLEKEDCEKMLKFPRHKTKSVYALILNEHDGVVKQTFKPSHHSWWRTSNFELETI